MMKKAEVIAVANPKGGCGKTTTAINLGACVAVQGRKVLLIDLDPQSGATTGVGMKPRLFKISIAELLSNSAVGVEKAVYSTKVGGLFIIPAKPSLAEVEVQLRRQRGGGLILKDKLESILSEYDYIFIDTSPSLGALTLNALAVSDKVIVPVQTQFYALRGLAQLLNMVNIVRERIDPGLCKVRILATMYDPRTRLSQSILSELRKNFKEELFHTIIPVSTRLAEAPSYGLPGFLYDPSCSGTKAYQRLAMEVISDEKK